MMTCKAWNGRVICQWLAETMALATAGLDPNHDEGRFTLACHIVILVCDKTTLVHRHCVAPYPFKPRNSMARWFWICESNQREMILVLHSSPVGAVFLVSYRSS